MSDEWETKDQPPLLVNHWLTVEDNTGRHVTMGCRYEGDTWPTTLWWGRIIAWMPIEEPEPYQGEAR